MCVCVFFPWCVMCLLRITIDSISRKAANLSIGSMYSIQSGLFSNWMLAFVESNFSPAD